MTTKELHIAIDLGLQNLNTNAYGKVRPEMKDWFLNESMIKFIKNRINPKSNNKKQGFASTIKRYEDLENLITPADINLYKYDDDSLYGILPYNYFHLLSSKTKVAFDCAGLTHTSTTTVNERICIVPLKDASTTKYNTFKIELNNGSGYTNYLDVANYSYLSSGIPTVDAKFVIINFVLEYWNNQKDTYNTGNVFWETYGDIYKQGCFIFVNNVSTNASIRITTDTVDVYNFSNESYIKYNYTISNDGYFKNRIEKTDDYDNLLQHSFGTTIPNSPLAKLQLGSIIVNHSKKFIANTCKIEFIRKPRRIDINLNQGCELDVNVHDEIVAMTVQKLKAVLSSANYSQIINENQLIE